MKLRTVLLIKGKAKKTRLETAIVEYFGAKTEKPSQKIAETAKRKR